MTEIKIDSPVKYEKKEDKIKIETDKLTPNSCKVVEVKEGWLKIKKLLVCMAENPNEITIKPIKEDKKQF